MESGGFFEANFLLIFFLNQKLFFAKMSVKTKPGGNISSLHSFTPQTTFTSTTFSNISYKRA